MKSYTAGIRKIATTGAHWVGDQENFMRIAYRMGYRQVAWNGEVYTLAVSVDRGVEFIKTDLTLDDFAFGGEDD